MTTVLIGFDVQNERVGRPAAAVMIRWGAGVDVPWAALQRAARARRPLTTAKAMESRARLRWLYALPEVGDVLCEDGNAVECHALACSRKANSPSVRGCGRGRSVALEG